MRITSFFAFFAGSLCASYSLNDPEIKCETPFPPFQLLSPTENSITWDIAMSPYAGGEDLLFAHRILEKIDTYYLGKSSFIYSEKRGSKFVRLTELIAIWMPLNYLAMVVQHEVFGHGYRLRDLQFKNAAYVKKYSFNTPLPYGSGGAATYYYTTWRFTTMEDSAVCSAGIEATAILAFLTKMHWMNHQKIDPRQALLYLLAEQDLTLYIGDLKSSQSGDLSGHDIHDYVVSVNETYPDHPLHKSTLYKLRWINLADPFTFYAIYSWFHYITSGQETNLRMIASAYLPGFRLGLTPFGPEIFFEQFIRHHNSSFYGYIKGGYHSNNFYTGMGVYVPSLWRKNDWTIGLRVDAWRQPKLLTTPEPNPLPSPIYSTAQTHQMRFGGAVSLITSYGESDVLRYEWEIGYKTKGFLEGYSLFAFPTIRLNLIASF